VADKHKDDDRLFPDLGHADEHEFRLAKVSGFDGGKDLEIGQQVSALVGGEVIAIKYVKRTRTIGGEGETEDYLCREVTIRATGAMLK
jgi:hypothetical protein